ncbi:hypothetical protein Tco_0843492 [Tanacetum coccineum]|uniref:Uncharacterized protein n=1 Tax=Tanacetum coccineum TaxID=301880 RepID=A0ABQ5B286_9ASTR
MMVMIKIVAVGEDEGDAAGAVVVTRWRWMRGGWCSGDDGDVVVVVMVAGAWVEETNDVHTYQEQGRSRKKPRKLKFDINLPSMHFCKPIKQILEGELKFWPTCDSNLKECNRGHEMYEMNKEGDLKNVKDPRERSFDNYKWMFDLEINQLADEYELGIGKKGHMLEDIWENCRKVQGDNTYWWHDKKSEEDERPKIGVE